MKRIFASVLYPLLVFALSSCGGTEQQAPSTPPEATQVPSQTKAEMFPYQIGEAGVPLINAAPVSMSCTVEDIYETEGFESFICKIAATYAEGSVLTPEGKIDYHTLKPVLFEMPTYEYLRTGEVIGKCMSFGTQEKRTEGDHQND